MGTSASFALARKITACFIAALLSLALVPASAFAEGEAGVDEEAGTSPRRVVASSQGLSAPLALPDLGSTPASSSTEAASPDVTLSEGAEGGEVEGSNKGSLTLASGLVGAPSNFINSDVALDGEPVIGSFTVDGLTFAVIDESHIELVGVSPDWQQVMSSQEGEGSGVAPMLASGSDGDKPDAAALVLPETITYEGTNYTLASIAPYAFYLSGVTSVTLPASVSDVDDRAFRSSDVASVSVAEGNQTYSSFDGALYSADKTRLLLIPEGRVGAVLLPREAEVAEAGKFSHCSLVDAISVEDGAAFASENGLLYTSDLTTLLRVPAGATEVTIREGCTTIAAGALEACAKLTTINAPATVTSISPGIFHAIPTVSLPAASVILSEGIEGPEVEESNEGSTSEAGAQLTAMVALSTIDDDVPEVEPSAIAVATPTDESASIWQAAGFICAPLADAEIQEASTYSAYGVTVVNHTASTVKGYALYDKVWSAAINPDQSFTYSSANYYQFADGYLFTTIDTNRERGYRWGIGTGAGIRLVLTSDTSPDADVSVSDFTALPSRLTLHVYDRDGFTVRFDANEGTGGQQESVEALYGSSMPAISTTPPTKKGYAFAGWCDPSQPNAPLYYSAQGASMRNWYKAADTTLYAQWQRADCDISFDTSAEPGDEDFPGIEKPGQTITGEQVEAGDGVEIEDPKRPGYVFQGWTIPNAEGTEASEQDLVYQGEDGKWYVDASKLPDYAGDDGRVELTARWTSVISVDVPSSVTFYADVVTQGNESREGLASSAFGQNKVQSQSEVDLRIVGLESKQVKGNGSTNLGASDILKKKDGSTVSGTVDKLFSLYPTTGELKEDDLKDPGATSASKPVDAVDFSLDDILLEKSFAAGEFTIPAGDTLSLGYRLNLQETSTELDYDKLSALSEGASASIANISYCFATGALIPTGSKTDPLWVENTDPQLGTVGVYGLADIKAAANEFASYAASLPANHDEAQEAEALLGSRYYKLFKGFFDDPQKYPFQLKFSGSYLKVQILGIAQDTRPDGRRAGITFGFQQLYAAFNKDVLGRAYLVYMRLNSPTNEGGWRNCDQRQSMRNIYDAYLDDAMKNEETGIVKVVKTHQMRSSGVQRTDDEVFWLPSAYEIWGAADDHSWYADEAATEGVFQYRCFQGNESTSANPAAVRTWQGAENAWWTRSAVKTSEHYISVVAGGMIRNFGMYPYAGILPCFAL